MKAHEKSEKKKGKDTLALHGKTTQKKLEILQTEYSAVKDFLKSRLDSINKTTETANQIFQDKTSQILTKDWNVSKPLATNPEPETPIAEPEAPAAKSETPIAEPEAPAAKSETPIAEPEAPAAKSETPIAEPETPITSLAQSPIT